MADNKKSREASRREKNQANGKKGASNRKGNDNSKSGNKKGPKSTTPSVADPQSTASSSHAMNFNDINRNCVRQQQPSKLLNNNEKVKMLKRNHSISNNSSTAYLINQNVPVPLMQSIPQADRNGLNTRIIPSMPPHPLIAKPLMEVELIDSKVGAAPYKERGRVATPEKSIAGRQAEANEKQRREYYFSPNAGCAVSSHTFQETCQYPINSFPLERNVAILIDNRFYVLITPTNSRCNGLYIKVGPQHEDSSISTGALLKLESDENTVWKACKETIDNYSIVASKSNADRFPFSNCSEEYLSSCMIKRLSERLDAFPEAIYYCEKCDYHINTISHAKAHLESSTHFDIIKRHEQKESLLKSLPKPTKSHLESVNKILKEQLHLYEKVRQDGITSASNILHYLNTSVFPSIGCKNVQLKPFGSSTYNVVLPDSDYNVSYTMDISNGAELYILLEKVRKRIVDDGHPADHSMEMGTSSTIIFTFNNIKVRLFWMSCFNYRSQLHFSDLMKVYVDLRKEVVQFLQLIRIWANKAGVDSKNKPRIGLPRYGFDIMAIHYLQQCDYLPVLHELFEEGPETEKIEEMSEESTARLQPEEAGQRRMRLMSRYEKNIVKIQEKFDLKKSWNHAELFLGFFRYYVQQHKDVVIQITQKAPMCRDANGWNKKVLHVVDPFRGDNVLSIPKVSSWQPYYFNCLLTTFLSFSIPRTKNGPIVEIELIHPKTKAQKKVKEIRKKGMETSEPMVQITEEQFRAAVEDELAEEREHRLCMQELINRLVIDGKKTTVRTPDDCQIDDHRNCVYSGRTLQRFRRVLEPESHKNRDILNSLRLVNIVRADVTDLLDMEFLTLQCDGGNEDATLAKKEPAQEITIAKCSTTAKNEDSAGTIQTDIEKIEIQCSLEDTKHPQTTRPDNKTSVIIVSPQMNSSALKPSSATFAKGTVITLKPDKQICSDEFFIKECNQDISQLLQKTKNLKASEYYFEFTTVFFCGNYEMEMKCTYCDGSHCVESCPMMEIPPIKKFEPRPPEELKDIDDIIDKYYNENIISKKRLNMLEAKKNELESFLRKNYQSNISLTMFGSVMTGLSVNCSDIDICLRFGDGDVAPKNLTQKQVILKTEEVLRKCSIAKKVQAIVTAKVPIVKFQTKLSNGETVDVDISYYNILAIYNTALLREYTLWTPDNRFSKLALFIKKWAKQCDIGDASRGSLSSYAHVILLISYLQNCDPPVLPRLQEDFRNDERVKRLIENWDTSFAQVEPQLIGKWQKNKESCAQLLIGFLNYYSKFDFRNFVVQCRRQMQLSKMEKEWSRPLCVEDPFDLSHNLSSGVTKKMFVFIMKVFINSRAVFMSEKPTCDRDANFLLSYQSQLLRNCNQGSAPTDRQCHQCHRIGHFVESCPQRLLAKEARKRYGSSSTNSSYRSNGQPGRQRNLETFYYRTYK